MSSSIQVAVLTVSDTASTNASADKSGPTIRALFDSRKGYVCAHYSIVPDDVTAIQSAVKEWTRSGDVDWIITTGGTGFGVRDRTPEAISPLLDREASGIVHLLLSTSLKHTPLAALSRPVAGTIGDTLIVTLPGSVKAVKENMDALLSNGVAEHAIELIKGGSGERTHAALAASASSLKTHSHKHHHHGHHLPHHHDHHHPQPRVLSHDPSQAVSTRNRVSPYPLISFENALDIIGNTIQRLPTITLKVDPNLKGYVLAEDVYAFSDVPPKPTTSVDGYALRSTDKPGTYKVLTSKTHSLSSPLPEGYVYRINTGGPLPLGADAIIMVEDTRLVSTHQGGSGDFEEGEENEVETLAQVPAGENLREPGSDVSRGDLVLQEGERILSSGGEIGTLAFVGRKEVKVYKKPVVAILSTGNEVIDLQKPSSAESSQGSDSWGIWDTNRPSLNAALAGMGYEVIDLGIVPDEIDAHTNALKQGFTQADLILTTGGTSMGPTDLLKPVIERKLGGTVHFGRVTVKPGKPTTFATVTVPGPNGDDTEGRNKPIFALPGNPASALVTFFIFVVPALRKMGGWPDEVCQLPRVRVRLETPMKLDTRTEFHRVIIRAGKDGLRAFSTGGQRSSRVASLSGANGLVMLPQRKENEGPAMLEIGDIAEAVMIGEIQAMV